MVNSASSTSGVVGLADVSLLKSVWNLVCPTSDLFYFQLMMLIGSVEFSHRTYWAQMSQLYAHQYVDDNGVMLGGESFAVCFWVL